MELPERTRTSNLTDSELILFDFLFDSIVPRPMLEKEEFLIHYNTGYSHDLNTQELNSVLDRFIKDDLLFEEKQNYWGKQVLFFGLTLKGGKIWESERKPIWSRYIVDAQDHTETDNIWKAEICSYSKETLITCVNYYVENGFFGDLVSSLKYAQLDSQCLIYWRIPSIVYECTFLVSTDGNEKIDWEKYNSERVWWRNVRELQKSFA